MNKGIICSILLIILLLVVSLIQIYVDSFFRTLDSKITTIEYKITENKENVDTENIHSLIKNLNNYWSKKITYICLMIDFKHISSIGESISRLQAGIETNDFPSCLSETKLLQRIIGALQKIFGLRLPNLL